MVEYSLLDAVIGVGIRILLSIYGYEESKLLSFLWGLGAVFHFLAKVLPQL